MPAYDPKSEKNQYPKMLYKGTEYRQVDDDKAEEKARADGYDSDTPSGRVAPKTNNTIVAGDRGAGGGGGDMAMVQMALAGVEARLKALEAEVFPEPVKGKK
jgi:hypothetical protein